MTSGERIGHYRIVRKLGEGGMGQVYLAEDTRLNRPVALKVLPESLRSNAERLARFRVEALAAAKLNHPNIATIYSIEETEYAGGVGSATNDDHAVGAKHASHASPLATGVIRRRYRDYRQPR